MKNTLYLVICVLGCEMNDIALKNFSNTIVISFSFFYVSMSFRSFANVNSS